MLKNINIITIRFIYFFIFVFIGSTSLANMEQDIIKRINNLIHQPEHTEWCQVRSYTPILKKEETVTQELEVEVVAKDATTEQSETVVQNNTQIQKPEKQVNNQLNVLQEVISSIQRGTVKMTHIAPVVVAEEKTQEQGDTAHAQNEPETVASAEVESREATESTANTVAAANNAEPSVQAQESISESMESKNEVDTLLPLTIQQPSATQDVTQEPSVQPEQQQVEQAEVASAPEPITDPRYTPIDKYTANINDITFGNKNAKVTVLVYLSPTCPHCSHFYNNVLPDLQKKYVDTGKVFLIMREFISNLQDLEASILTRCSGKKDLRQKFWNVLMTRQSSWAFNKNFHDLLANIGAIGGVSKDKFEMCVADQKLIKTIVDASRELSATPGFLGTPAIVIDNDFHTGGYSMNEMSKHIDASIKGQKYSSPK